MNTYSDVIFVATMFGLCAIAWGLMAWGVSEIVRKLEIYVIQRREFKCTNIKRK